MRTHKTDISEIPDQIVSDFVVQGASLVTRKASQIIVDATREESAENEG